MPWDDAGSFLRFSVTYEAPDEAAEDQLMAETESRLKQIRPEFVLKGACRKGDWLRATGNVQ